MKDGFSTADLDAATAICYLMDGFDTLTQVTMEKDSRGILFAHFTLDAASLDCEQIVSEFTSGQLAISDLMAWCKIYNRIVNLLKIMRKSGQESWASHDWVNGKRG